jgi:hypothetical protein
MTILKKDVTEEGKIFYTFIDESFYSSKNKKGVIVRAAFYFPNVFVQDAKNGEHKFINVSEQQLLEGLIIAKDKVEKSTEEVKSKDQTKTKEDKSMSTK